ncbi:hypothetical protein ACQKFL_12295 [Vreelandella titanicae]|uniref:hypothetical protein n=1 Tax=Vreelandella titanicae TaxID=664683 RepID=UPI003D03B9E3|tara:strand:+ start:5134 stop:5841 length:708 start_codon:yes stop_codon:yes gene_type:complete
MKQMLMLTMVFILSLFIGFYLGVDFVVTKVDVISQKSHSDLIGLMSSIGSFILAAFMAVVAVYIYVKWDKRHRDEKVVEIKLSIYDALSDLEISCKNLTSYYDRKTRFKNYELIESLNKAHISLEKEISKFYFFMSEDNRFGALTHSVEKEDFLRQSKQFLHLSRALCHYFSIGGFEVRELSLYPVMPTDIFTEEIFEKNIVENREQPAGHINMRLAKIKDSAVEELMSELYKKI